MVKTGEDNIMSEEAIMKQMNRAIERAMRVLNNPEGACKIIRLNDSNCPFHLECCRTSKKEVQKIRIALDKVTEEDIELCRDWPLNELHFTKEIWLTKKGQKKFVSHPI